MIITTTPTIEGHPIKEYGPIIHVASCKKHDLVAIQKEFAFKAEMNGYNAVVGVSIMQLAPSTEAIGTAVII